jgi:hypothetical protein
VAIDRIGALSDMIRGGAVLLALVTAACAAAAPPPRSLDPNADVVVPYPVSGGGEVRFTVHPKYLVGHPVTLELDLTAGTKGIHGPISGRVIASGLEGERTVRVFAPSDLRAVDVKPGEKSHVQVVWDGRDGNGVAVQQETYSLTLDFLLGGESVRLGSVIEVRSQ